jgi:hypothetical protein
MAIYRSQIGHFYDIFKLIKGENYFTGQRKSITFTKTMQLNSNTEK